MTIALLSVSGAIMLAGLWMLLSGDEVLPAPSRGPWWQTFIRYRGDAMGYLLTLLGIAGLAILGARALISWMAAD